MKIEILTISCCLIGTILCDTAIGFAPVSARERKQGYSCKSTTKELGLMRSGEEKTNYIPGRCILAICGDGVISYYGCGITVMELRDGTKCESKPDDSLPYPDCCNIMIC